MMTLITAAKETNSSHQAEILMEEHDKNRSFFHWLSSFEPLICVNRLSTRSFYPVIPSCFCL